MDNPAQDPNTQPQNPAPTPGYVPPAPEPTTPQATIPEPIVPEIPQTPPVDVPTPPQESFAPQNEQIQDLSSLGNQTPPQAPAPLYPSPEQQIPPQPNQEVTPGYNQYQPQQYTEPTSYQEVPNTPQVQDAPPPPPPAKTSSPKGFIIGGLLALLVVGLIFAAMMILNNKSESTNLPTPPPATTTKTPAVTAKANVATPAASIVNKPSPTPKTVETFTNTTYKYKYDYSLGLTAPAKIAPDVARFPNALETVKLNLSQSPASTTAAYVIVWPTVNDVPKYVTDGQSQFIKVNLYTTNRFTVNKSTSQEMHYLTQKFNNVYDIMLETPLGSVSDPVFEKLLNSFTFLEETPSLPSTGLSGSASPSATLKPTL